ncbi:MAG: NAD-dependent dehydratase [Marine Group III euryarchaeote CG-Epi6]|uniref:UDP-glucuronate decarboxylase n=1 Tax=Marine Group III euryarchaeote CG-Epi6 TaxID=1889000 RepID=A0A1J5T1T2_9ARCH|nr:MAG: NAD-dependent dehydratase [Marine Group III euryarchaeote CG-Epi6]
MKYLVTGGAGFIGSTLCRRLLSDGHSVACLDDLSTGNYRNIEKLEENPDFEFFKHDLTKPFYPDKIDAIFNLACPASPVHYQYNPIRTLKMGTLAIYNVLGMASRLNVPILQASTSEIYGDPSVHPQSESYLGNVNPIGPRACYDEGKRVAEALFIAYENFNNVDIRIARIFNTYGPHMDPQDGRVVSNFINQALVNQPITVYGDGTQTRSFCYVSDLVDGLISLINSDYKRPINLGNPDEYSMLQFAELVREIIGSNSEIIFCELPIDDPKRRCPDIRLANEILGWAPSIDLKEGLENTVKWYQKILDLAVDK